MRIDIHVHSRDGKQSYKDSVEKCIDIYYRAGSDGFCGMPNTDPPLTSEETIKDELKRGDDTLKKLNLKGKFFHGVWGGITADLEQIEEVVNVYTDHQRVVGLKMFAGQSTGNMGLVDDKFSSGEQKQRLVYQTLKILGYKGVLAVHCEKEKFMQPTKWDPEFPFTHTLARPPKAEVKSVKDQIKFAYEVGFKGTLHVCHISVPQSLEEIEKAREYINFKITCGITPHHALLYDEMMHKLGTLLKMNPPLRPKYMQEAMLRALHDGRIDLIEGDHANHSLDEKLGIAKTENGEPIYASGIPVSPFIPSFIRILKEKGMPDKQIKRLTYDNPIKIFGLEGLIPFTQREPDYNLAQEYEFDPFSVLKDSS